MMVPPNLRLWFFLASAIAVGTFFADLAARVTWFSVVLDRIIP